MPSQEHALPYRFWGVPCIWSCVCVVQEPVGELALSMRGSWRDVLLHVFELTPQDVVVDTELIGVCQHVLDVLGACCRRGWGACYLWPFVFFLCWGSCAKALLGRMHWCVANLRGLLCLLLPVIPVA